jgi:hypothetical protein
MTPTPALRVIDVQAMSLMPFLPRSSKPAGGR